MLRSFPLFALLLLMAGCQAQAVKPGAPPEAPAADSVVAEPQSPLLQRFDKLMTTNEQVEQRITLMQEQLIKVNQQLQAMQQRNGQLLQAMQRLQLAQSQGAQARVTEASGSRETAASNEDQLTALVFRLEQLSAEWQAQPRAGAAAAENAGFSLVSAYTPKGQWVIFKYDQASGLTWNAEDGGWNEVAELESLPLSAYQVVLRPAAGDVKGYVAARIDRETGRSWWLKGNTWEPFQ